MEAKSNDCYYYFLNVKPELLTVGGGPFEAGAAVSAIDVKTNRNSSVVRQKKF